MVRVHPDLLAALDAFRAAQDGKPSRPEAVRLLVRRGLDAPLTPESVPAAAEALRPDQLNSANDG